MPSCPHTLQDIYNDTVYITSFDPNPPSKTLNPVTTPIKAPYPLYPSSPHLRLVHHVGAEDERVPLRLGARHAAVVVELAVAGISKG